MCCSVSPHTEPQFQTELFLNASLPAVWHSLFLTLKIPPTLSANVYKTITIIIHTKHTAKEMKVSQSVCLFGCR